MNEVQPNNQNTELSIIGTYEFMGETIAIYNTPEDPLFLAKDVAEWIEHSRASEMVKSVDNEEKLIQTILASGQRREVWFLTEDGLYEVFMQSRKLKAKKFKKKVKAILKEIRTKGRYRSEPADNPTERLAQIISNCTMVEQIDLIRDLYAIPHTPQNSPVEPQKAKPVQNNQETAKVLKNRDFAYSEDRYKSIDAFLKTYKVESGELTKEVYQRYVAFCSGRGVIPRTRQAFVLRMKTVTRLDIIQGRYGSVITTRS